MRREFYLSAAGRSGLIWALLGIVAGASPFPLAAQTPNPQTARQNAKLLDSTGFAVVRADRQRYDRQLGQLVASGNVEVTVQGWRLWADRLDYSETSRTLRASGQVRLQKGDQYLQASSLRYSAWEGSGELLDVYGVIDRDTLRTALLTTTDPSNPTAAPAFACPPLTASAIQRTTIHLLPLSRQPLPTIAAPPGCPDADPAKRARLLSEALNDVAMGAGAPARSATLIAPVTDERQRVRQVEFQQSLETSIKVNLAAVIDTKDTNNNPAGGRYVSNQGPKGSITRIRFQSSRLNMQGDRWSAEEVAFTNDPYTPANSWTIARKVTAVMDRPSGVTRIQAQNSRILIDQQLSIPAITDATIGEDQIPLVIDADEQDRGGIYLGYNLPPIRLGQKGSLQLQPQIMVQRAFEGTTDSYIQPGAGLGTPTVEQSIKAGDVFGLEGLLNLPIAGMQLNANLSISTFNPDNFVAGTRSIASLSKPLGLSWAPSATASLFGGYRERVYNGSLGLQNLIWSYGARLTGGNRIPLSGVRQNKNPGNKNNPESAQSRGAPYFEPLNISWNLQSGNYQANLFQNDQLATLWRTNLNLQASTFLRLWNGGSRKVDGRGLKLRYAAIPVIPGLGFDIGLAGNLNYYSDGFDQNTLSLWAGPAITLGNFEKPYLDYTRLAVAVGGTLLSGLSPFGFDRAVDLRTISFSAAQQIYGPLVVEGGATFNIDPNSEFYGESSYSYVEVKLQRRSYEIGLYYSPYDGIGGIRLTLNDFNFTGTGTPFVPRPTTPAGSAGPLSQR